LHKKYLIEKVTVYNMLKIHEGIDFSSKEQRRKTSKIVIKLYKNVYRSHRLTKIPDEKVSYNSTLPKLAMRSKQKKEKVLL